MAVKGKLRKNPEFRSQKSELGIRRGFATNFHEFLLILMGTKGEKGTKEDLNHEGTKEHEVSFYRIYRMIRISAVEGSETRSLAL